ncbi:hypothetical protein R1sor_024580 [Riccia sorocarpa]|uniref:SHSP domain-containing protein n=1 Tax=Riccia sorocarpa TaxID=122646 RepID=A0ABD3GUW7_9MARC
MRTMPMRGLNIELSVHLKLRANLRREMGSVDVLLGNKRLRMKTGEDTEDTLGEESPEMNPAIQPRAYRTNLPQFSSPSLILRDLNSEKKSSGWEVVFSKDEARSFLREEGWQVTVIMRKSSTRGSCSPFWYYKAPLDGNCTKQITFPSLPGAIDEYNRRVRFHNIINMEQKPVVHLRKGADCLEAHEVSSVKTRITEKKGKIPPRRSLLLRPLNVEEPFCSAARTAQGSVQDTCAVTLPSEESTEAGASGDAGSAVVRTFGAFTRNLVEEDGEYFLDIDVLNFRKDQLRIHVEKNKLIVSATYSSESSRSEFSVTTGGDMTTRVTLPDNAISHLVTAKLELGSLRLRIPKCRS